jgi:hypothetical protein
MQAGLCCETPAGLAGLLFKGVIGLPLAATAEITIWRTVMSNIHRGKDELDPAVYCAECMKEILTSQAYDPEGMDYEENFCAIECYEAWNRKLVSERENDGGDEEKIGVDDNAAPGDGR